MAKTPQPSTTNGGSWWGRGGQRSEGELEPRGSTKEAEETSRLFPPGYAETQTQTPVPPSVCVVLPVLL